MIDAFIKYVQIKPLKEKKLKQFLMVLLELWVDQGRNFYNNLMQKWLGNNNVLMYLTNNEAKPVVAERFKRTLLGKIYEK